MKKLTTDIITRYVWYREMLVKYYIGCLGRCKRCNDMTMHIMRKVILVHLYRCKEMNRPVNHLVMMNLVNFKLASIVRNCKC